MNLNQLYYFVELAHREHYIDTAKALFIAQPSLSKAIAGLERELGTRLFEKKGRNVTLTKYGRVFLEYAEQSLAALDNGIRKMHYLTGEKSGRIALGYIYTMGTEYVPGLLSSFLAQTPDLDVEFDLRVGNSTLLLAELKQEKLDLILSSRREDEQEIQFEPVREEEMVVIVPSGHPLAGKKAIDLEETLPYPQIAFTKDSGLRPVIDKLFAGMGKEPVVAYEIEEDGAMAGLVAAGFGIAVLPRVPVLKHLPLHIIRIQSPEIHRYIYLAHMKDKYRTPVAELFRKHVLANS